MTPQQLLTTMTATEFVEYMEMNFCNEKIFAITTEKELMVNSLSMTTIANNLLFLYVAQSYGKVYARELKRLKDKGEISENGIPYSELYEDMVDRNETIKNAIKGLDKMLSTASRNITTYENLHAEEKMPRYSKVS